jgi:hypothetical protein
MWWPTLRTRHSFFRRVGVETYVRMTGWIMIGVASEISHAPTHPLGYNS